MNIPEQRIFQMKNSTTIRASASNFGLPSAFVRKVPNPIKRKTRGKPGFHRLPFVANWHAKSSAPLWNVPASGGYFGGYRTGEAMAQAFLKFLREDELDSLSADRLTGIAESFMVRFAQEGGEARQNQFSAEWGDAYQSFRGQYVGFFNTLSRWLVASAKHLGSSLDGVEEQDLVRRANAGLGFDEAAYMAALTD